MLAPIVAEIYGPDYAGVRRYGARGRESVPRRHRTSSTSTPASKPMRRASCRRRRSRARGAARPRSGRHRARAARRAVRRRCNVSDGRPLANTPCRCGCACRAGDQAALEPAARAARARARRRARAAVGSRAGCSRRAWEQVDLPQGPAALRLRHRRRCRRDRQPAVRHVRHGRAIRARKPVDGHRLAQHFIAQPPTHRRNSRSNGTANGRSPTRRSATWAWPIRSACC